MPGGIPVACMGIGRHGAKNAAYQAVQILALEDTDLRDKGFAKLVRRDNGVYENVTALEGESRYWDANKPETMPDIKRRVSD